MISRQIVVRIFTLYTLMDSRRNAAPVEMQEAPDDSAGDFCSCSALRQEPVRADRESA